MVIQNNFFALIKEENGNCEIRRIRVNQPLQIELTQIFENQRDIFEMNVVNEIVFNGDWKPDDNEVLTIDDLPEARLMKDAINANASSFSDLNIAQFSNKPIRAIFTGRTVNGETEVYVQKFSSRQALSLSQLPIIRMQTGNTFIKTTDDTFTIDSKLVAIIEDNKTKFKSFHNARMVFDLSTHYKEATDDDLSQMIQHSSLEVSDQDSFIDEADAQVRKMVHSIERSGVLNNYTVHQISSAAANFPSVPLSVNNGKIALPSDKKQLKEILHFLLEDIYKGALSGSDYLTNSKRLR